MAPPFRNSRDPDAWWKNAWKGTEHVSVLFEIECGKDIIKPGTLIKFKNQRGTFKFRCLAHNTRTDATWIDCIDVATSQYRAFDADKLKGIVKPKKSRRRKPNV